MIPKNISRHDVVKAIEQISEQGIPTDRHSTKWSLAYEDVLYPPKYVVSVANHFANGEEWDPSRFSGGEESNQFLASLGFKVVASPSKQGELPLEIRSWKVLSDTVVVKEMDRSSFLHSGSGIPIQVRPFFGLEEFDAEETRRITLNHKGVSYEARFSLDVELTRVRLFWKADFSEVLQRTFPDWHAAFSQNTEMTGIPPRMRMNRVTQNGSAYEVELISPSDIESDIDAEIDEEQQPKPEGAVKYYYGKRYERDPGNRAKAIEIHGTRCVVCGFDFEAVYGIRGRGFIEVHHTKPLSSTEVEQIVDPRTDLAPVCSNCHRVIHRRKDDVLSVEELKSMLGVES